MGDRALPRVNKLVAARKQNYEFNLHRNNVRKKKAAVNTSAPAQQKHLALRLKRKQMEAERMDQVERENSHLLDKMRKLMLEPQIIMEPPFAKGSLNRESRKREMIRIMNENEALLKRIQNRPSNYSVSKWEKEHVAKEKLLCNIGDFPHRRPPRKRLPRVTHSAGSRRTIRQRKVVQPQRTCVFSKADIDINGVNSVVSVYELTEPFRLEIVALDDQNLSNRKPVAIQFSELRARYRDNLDLLTPERTDDLVMELLKLLQFGPDPKNRGTLLQLQFKPEKPQHKPRHTSRKTKSKGKKLQVDYGEVMPINVKVSCSGLPETSTHAVVSLKNKNAVDFKVLGNSEVVKDTTSPSFSKSFSLDTYEKMDRELRVEIVGAHKPLGAVTVAMSLFTALPSGEVELKMVDEDGNSVADAMVTLTKVDDKEPKSSRKQAITRGGVTMLVRGEQEQFLYTVTVDQNNWCFSFYLQSSKETYEAKVSEAEFENLENQLNVGSLELSTKSSQADWAGALLPLFSTQEEESNISVVFNVPIPVTVECRDLQKEGSDASVDALVRCVMQTGNVEVEMGTTEKLSDNNPCFTTAIEAKKLGKGQTLVLSVFDVGADGKLTDDDVIGFAEVSQEALSELLTTKELTLKLNNRDGVQAGKSTMVLRL